MLPACSCWNESQGFAGLMIFCLSQPLGSVSHVCPHRAGRLSGRSQLHLGDAEAGLQEDALPRQPVRPVQPQLLAENEVTFCSPFPDFSGRAGGDWADLVVWLEERSEESVSVNIKPRIKVYNKNNFNRAIESQQANQYFYFHPSWHICQELGRLFGKKKINCE